MNNQKNNVSKFNMSRIVSDEIKNIIDEIELLISNRKKIEKDFEQLRKKLLIGKKTNVIDSSNWEDWKMLSLEYGEIKQIINEIDEKWLALKQVQVSLKKKHNDV
ncbi:MAG TPA: hypothetical protein VFW99_00400 [Candidatus Nitrosotalea sp.]|nr:hypothetical protein [Candidatus Nitrosotalea sp.]